MGELRDMDVEHWYRIIDVNLRGVINGTTIAYAQMVRQGHGHIVNVSSVLGLVPLATHSAYSATKHAIVGLTTSMRPEAERLGVKVSVVCPGTLNTSMMKDAMILRADRDALSRPGKGRHKVLEPRDAAKAALDGIQRNSAVIVFPFSARLLWWVHRLHPSWTAPIHSFFMDALRAARTAD